MPITTGDISTFGGLTPATKNIYVIPDPLTPQQRVQLVYRANDSVIPLQSLAKAKTHPLTAPGVGIVNFRPSATSGTPTGFRPSARGAQILLQVISNQELRPSVFKLLLLQTASGTNWTASADLSLLLADQVVGNGYPAGGITYTPATVPAGSIQNNSGIATQTNSISFTATGAITLNALALAWTVNGTDEFIAYIDETVNVVAGNHTFDVELNCTGVP